MGQIGVFGIIIAVGVTMGLLAVGIVYLYGRAENRRHRSVSQPFVRPTLSGAIGIGNLAAPATLLANVGQTDNARMSLSTVVMTPTKGLRLVSLAGSALILALLWSPVTADDFGNLNTHIIATAALGYAALYIAVYEARYDAEGITLPTWYFMDRHYPWEEFISIRDDGHYLYKLRFERGRISLQKYLVGMPTFLTFVSDVREMNRRL